MISQTLVDNKKLLFLYSNTKLSKFYSSVNESRFIEHMKRRVNHVGFDKVESFE